MKFWDSSAIVPLLVVQERSKDVQQLLKEDRLMVVCAIAVFECYGALTRLLREGFLVRDSFSMAVLKLDKLIAAWKTVELGGALTEEVKRVLRVYPLRTADSIQLASAIISCEKQPSTGEFVCLDDKLAGCAEKEGFEVWR